MICRLCLMEKSKYVQVYPSPENEDASSQIALVIRKHLKIKTFSTDLICHDCYTQLKKFHNFWLQVKINQKTLNNTIETIVDYSPLGNKNNEISTALSEHDEDSTQNFFAANIKHIIGKLKKYKKSSQQTLNESKEVPSFERAETEMEKPQILEGTSVSKKNQPTVRKQPEKHQVFESNECANENFLARVSSSYARNLSVAENSFNKRCHSRRENSSHSPNDLLEKNLFPIKFHCPQKSDFHGKHTPSEVKSSQRKQSAERNRFQSIKSAHGKVIPQRYPSVQNNVSVYSCKTLSHEKSKRVIVSVPVKKDDIHKHSKSFMKTILKDLKVESYTNLRNDKEHSDLGNEAHTLAGFARDAFDIQKNLFAIKGDLDDDIPKNPCPDFKTPKIDTKALPKSSRSIENVTTPNDLLSANIKGRTKASTIHSTIKEDPVSHQQTDNPFPNILSTQPNLATQRLQGERKSFEESFPIHELGDLTCNYNDDEIFFPETKVNIKESFAENYDFERQQKTKVLREKSRKLKLDEELKKCLQARINTSTLQSNVKIHKCKNSDSQNYFCGSKTKRKKNQVDVRKMRKNLLKNLIAKDL